MNFTFPSQSVEHNPFSCCRASSLRHRGTEMESKGNDALLKTTKVTEWNVHYGGYFAIAFGGFILLGCVVAYLLCMARGNVDAVLPLISDAAGSPPQNGLFGTLICLGGMCGVVFMIQRYMIVAEKNCEKSSVVTLVNKISLFFGIVALLGITLITGYPVNFYRNRDVWLMDVGLPHMIGGVTLFSLGLVYMAFQTILTLFLKNKNETSLLFRILLLFICTGAFVYHMITVPGHFSGISHLYYMNRTDGSLNYTGILPYPPTMGADLKIPIDTGGSYINAAISQWVFVIFFCCFFFTFYKEAQEYSLLIVIETHAKDEPEGTEESKPDLQKIQAASQVGNKPPPEMRKVLRRDSTCQTTIDEPDSTTKKLFQNNELTKNAPQAAKNPPLKSKKNEMSNGNGKILTDVDTKLKQLLSENKTDEETETVEIAQPTGHTDVSVGSDIPIQEKAVEEEDGEDEERKAIERIDAVVKNAEDAVSNGVQQKQENSTTIKKSEEEAPSTCPLSVQ